MQRRTLAQLLATTLAVVLTAALGTEVATADRALRVPNVTGMDLDDAVRRLDAAGLPYRIRWISEEEPGRVASQRPQANARVRESAGAVVELVVGLRIRVDTLVPDLIGMHEAAVVAGLEPVYFVEVEEVPAPLGEDGRVVAQSPPPESRLPFRGVVHVSVGRADLFLEEIVLPSLKGDGWEDAEAALLAQGLIPVPSFVRSHGSPAWSILRQNPPGGTVVHPGTRVDLEVARPFGHRRPVRVPSLYGLDSAATLRVLAGLGLRATIQRVPSVFPQDTVVKQRPAPGIRVAAGTSIEIALAVPSRRGRAPARVRVPNFHGLPLDQVWSQGRASGLRLAIRRRLAPEQDVDSVIGQRPAPGEMLPLGGAVHLDLPRVTETPRLTGRSPAEAAHLAEEAGLEILFEGDERRGQRSRVVAQTPDAGTRVAMGTAVRAVLRGRGHPGRRVAVPDLVGLTATAARDRLAAAGLRGRFAGPSRMLAALTEVISQDPRPGVRVPRGSLVRIVVGLRTVPGARIVRVPGLQGRSLDDAQRRLVERGLVPIPSIVKGGGPTGVTGQSPAPGALVRRGSEVRFTYRR